MPFTDDDRDKFSEMHADVKTILGAVADHEVRLRKVEKRQFHFMGWIAGAGAVISTIYGMILKK